MIDEMSSAPTERDALEAAKRASVGQLLMKCGRLLNDLGVEAMRDEMGFEDIRAAHTNLFPHIDLEGTRLTDLAKRVGISKQAVGQLVDELEGMGALERVPDPDDGRAKLIRFAREGGKSVLLRGLGVLRDIEADMEEHIGARRMKELHRALLAVESWLLTKETDLRA
jgi:DNA-binding MarR family transcriptional regulator